MNDLVRQDDYDYEVETSFPDDMEFHKYISTYINKYFEQLENLSPEDQITHKSKIIKIMVKRFYKVNDESNLNKDRKNFFLGKDKKGRINLYLRYGHGNEVRLTWYEGGVLKFYKFGTIRGNYNKTYRGGGTDFIRSVLGVEHYDITNQHINEVENRLERLNEQNRDITSEQEAEELLETSSNASTSVKEILTSFDKETQTKVDMREMNGLLEANTKNEEEITNQLPRLYEINRKIEEKKERNKIS